MRRIMLDVVESIRESQPFCKVDDSAKDYTFVYGPVLVPEVVDKQNDIISADEIEAAAHRFMEGPQAPGLMHTAVLGKRDAMVVESHVTRYKLTFGKTEVPVGSWMVGMRVYSPKLRKMIRDGKLKGYSIGGIGKITEEDAG